MEKKDIFNETYFCVPAFVINVDSETPRSGQRRWSQ